METKISLKKSTQLYVYFTVNWFPFSYARVPAVFCEKSAVGNAFTLASRHRKNKQAYMQRHSLIFNLGTEDTVNKSAWIAEIQYDYSINKR